MDRKKRFSPNRRLTGWLIALAVAFCLGLGPVNASRYFFAANGDDLRNNGTSLSPWKSIDKLNEIMSTLSPGDSVLLRRGDIFKGSIKVTSSGVAGQPIYIGAYGKGAKPVISGLSKVLTWSRIAKNLYEAQCHSCQGKLTNLLINGVRQPMGRWPNLSDPNRGYLKINWASGNNRLSSSAIPDPEKWDGSEVVIRTNRWVLERLPILAMKGDTLTLTPTSYDIDKEFGFFISNHPRTLDQNGEWYFDKNTNRISLFSLLPPEKLVVEVPVNDHLLSIDHQEFIVAENLVMKGAAMHAIQVTKGHSITIRHTESILTGSDAVFFDLCRNSLFEKNTVKQANSSGLLFAACRGAVIRHNDIRNVGMVPGMGTGGASYNYSGIGIFGASNTLEHNRIDSAGYHGLRFDGDSTTVRNNVISNFCMVKDDGGGIYTWGKGSNLPEATRRIIGNIVFNGIGAAHGTDDTLRVSAEGIYVDDHCNNVEVIGNTAFKCGNVGIFIHNSSTVTIRNNLSYDNGIQLQMLSAGMPQSTIHTCEIKNNKLIAAKPDQRIATFITDGHEQDIRKMGDIDSNYYCRPANPDMILLGNYNSDNELTNKTFSLKNWQKEFGFDLHSGVAPVRFHYKIRKLMARRKITYGYYNKGNDVWYSEVAENSPVIEKLKGNEEEKGMNKWMIMAMKSAFVKGEMKQYLLRFETRGGHSGEIIRANFKTRDNQIICSKEFRLDTVFQANELLFIPSRINAPFERVNFEFSSTRVPVWIRNISFQEAQVAIPDPADHILFLTNPTALPRFATIGTGFVDVKGKNADTRLLLSPYSSEIFFKK